MDRVTEARTFPSAARTARAICVPLRPMISALADYTGFGYEDLNDVLRSDAVDASQHARVEALRRALEKLPPYEGPVIRGTNLPPHVLSQYEPGEVVTEHAFLSTTTNTAVARSPMFAGNAEFRILSSTGRDVSPFSVFPDEHEILFTAGTKFHVLSKVIDPLTGRTIIRMVEARSKSIHEGWTIGSSAVSKRIAGKTFSTPEEAGVTPPTQAELVRAQQIFDEFEEKIDAVPEEDRAQDVSPKFWDDLSGTEYDPRRNS
jgi:ADP-ribosyltransferase exoenzyme